MKDKPPIGRALYPAILLVLGTSQSGIWAQPKENIPLPSVSMPPVQDVVPLAVKESAITPLVGVERVGIGEVAPIALDASAYRVAAAIKKLRAREITPQQAWDSKALDVDDLIYFLEKGLDSWGGFFWEKDTDLRRGMVALLVDHGSEKLKKPEELSPIVRLWLADYYGSIKDERVLALSEGILMEMPRPLPKIDSSTGAMPLAFQALERIGWYYDATGQNLKCAQAWLRMSDYCPQKGWWLGDMWLMSARALYKDGKRDEAQKLRANVRGIGNGWITALADYEEARPLINAGKLSEARVILSRPLDATEQVNDGKIAQNAWLASLSYQEGNLEAVMRYGKAAMQAAKGIEIGNASLKTVYAMGCDVYNRAEAWKAQPIQTETKKLVLNIPTSSQRHPVYKRFRVKTYREPTIVAAVAHPAVQVQVVPLINWHRSGLNTQEYQVEVVVQAFTNQCCGFDHEVLKMDGRRTTFLDFLWITTLFSQKVKGKPPSRNTIPSFFVSSGATFQTRNTGYYSTCCRRASRAYNDTRRNDDPAPLTCARAELIYSLTQPTAKAVAESNPIAQGAITELTNT